MRFENLCRFYAIERVAVAVVDVRKHREVAAQREYYILAHTKESWNGIFFNIEIIIGNEKYY